MPRLWVDVLDASGNKLGAGPLTSVINARVIRVLDGVGQVTVTVPATDKRAVDLLANDRRIAIYAQLGSTVREIGRGIVKSRTLVEEPAGWKLAVSGPDLLHDLKNTSVLLGRVYDNVSTGTAVSGLATLAGWTVTDTSSETVYARFDGASVLKAIQTIAQNTGNHFRYDSGTTIEFGPLGANNVLYMLHKNALDRELYANADIALIERLQVAYESEDLVNWVLPLGAGEGVSKLTLANSTRTTPYTIQSGTGPDGETYYYIADSTSIAAYGQVQQIVSFKDVKPLSNTATDLERAANYLYDAAVAWLQRRMEQQVAYKVTVKKAWAASIKPGDKINVVYAGYVFRDGERVDYVDLDGEYWVLAVTENVGHAQSVSLTLSSVDRLQQNTAQEVVNRLEQAEARNLIAQSFPTQASYTYVRMLDSSNSASIPILITDAVTTLVRCKVRLKSRPFRSNVGGLTDNSHRHTYASNNVVAPGGGTKTIWKNIYVLTGTSTYTQIPVQFTVRSSELLTGPWATGTTPGVLSGYAISYGIFDDTDYPDHVTLSVNGTDRTLALTGSSTLDDSGTGLDVTVDVTEYLNSAAGGLWQEHEIEIECTGGQGEIEAVVDLFFVIRGDAI